MKTVSSSKEIRSISRQLKSDGKKIGFVPTMGSLHEGHLSLVKQSKANSDATVVSIFVNPTQFAPSEDFNDYPRNIEKDKNLLEAKKVDYLFLPSIQDIYPENFQTYVNVERISKKLEGESRPTHFRGVCTVVSILFNCVQPDFAFFGQKDAQQLAVLKQMVKDLNYDVRLVSCPIVREPDGLAMSSRNIYLSGSERKDALVLFQSLELAKKLVESNERRATIIVSEMSEMFLKIESAKLDYIRIVESDSFEIVDDLKGGKEYFVLVACKIGKTRLIDNALIMV